MVANKEFLTSVYDYLGRRLPRDDGQLQQFRFEPAISSNSFYFEAPVVYPNGSLGTSEDDCYERVYVFVDFKRKIIMPGIVLKIPTEEEYSPDGV